MTVLFHPLPVSLPRSIAQQSSPTAPVHRKLAGRLHSSITHTARCALCAWGIRVSSVDLQQDQGWTESAMQQTLAVATVTRV